MRAPLAGILLLLLPTTSRPGKAQVSTKQEGAPKRANRLAGESSPYLLQHAHNPVDWYPWGKEALAKARKEDKPIFLSIGYSACHWCHVMERESFEDPKIAAFLNEHFVSIKVDREERPDLDEVYMAATVRMTGSGGWPMSVFLTPDRKPFFAGTYFPPRDRGGMPGFDRVLEHVHKLWTTRRKEVEKAGDEILGLIERELRVEGKGDLPGKEVFDRAVRIAGQRFDVEHGGFGQPPRFAPKFPHCTEMTFLLRYGVRSGREDAVQMVEKTLEAMARGGIHDQVGGGFHRYAVDREWLVPHFEKMLYDNAQLAALYTEAWQATGKVLFRRTVEDILEYVAREMTSPEGGFYSTTDADSEGEEGRFFLWTRAELFDVLGEEDGALAAAWFGVTEEGNFEGRNILTARRDPAEMKDFVKEGGLRARLRKIRAKLRNAREKRVHPRLDDKVLASWNGLMLSAFARAGSVLGREDWLATARRNADFLLSKMRDEKGRLFRTRRNGRSRLLGFLEDHAAVANGLLDLYEADGDPRWLKAAVGLQERIEEHFVHEGRYVSVSDEHERLIVRPGSAQESSLPSDIGLAATSAARLGLLLGKPEWISRARSELERIGTLLAAAPNGFGQCLILADFLAADPKEIYVAGPPEDESTRIFLEKARRLWPPYRVLAWIDPDRAAEISRILPPAEGKTPIEGKPAAYVCTEGVCKEPVVDPSLFLRR